MGRSVMTLSGADAIAYDWFEPDEEYCKGLWEDPEEDWTDIYDSFEDMMWGCWDEDSEDQFHWYLVGIQDRAHDLWRSMEACDYWTEREVHVIAENAHSIITISEYSGSVAICLGAKYDREGYTADDSEVANLGAHWRKQISEKFLEVFSPLVRIGGFSDGTSVYEKKA